MPGKYYLEVSDNHQQNCISKKTYFAYELRLNESKIDKYECNNDVSSATTINVNENITASVDFFGDKDYYVFPILKNDSLIVEFNITEAQLLKIHLQDANHILPEMKQILSGTNGLHYSFVYPKGGFSGNYILYTEPFNSYSHDDYSFIVKTGSTTATTEQIGQELEVHPNPVKDNLLLNYKPGKDESVYVEIINLFGQCVVRYNIKEENQLIDVNSLVPGCYIINLISGNTLYTTKFIKE
jgi:hypothetical protein